MLRGWLIEVVLESWEEGLGSQQCGQWKDLNDEFNEGKGDNDWFNEETAKWADGRAA